MIPTIIYGTAWKEQTTASWTYEALRLGYRAIDTANQRQHYFEEGVGAALSKAMVDLQIPRESLFLQTKYTYPRGQDHRKPYDERVPFEEQVRQSFESSLKHLGIDYLDSLVLHSPYGAVGLNDKDKICWQAMEELFQATLVRNLGVSNVSIEQLQELVTFAKIKPRFVQNRCYAQTRWDKAIREYCRGQDIFYQGFSLLTANRQYLGGEVYRSPDRKTPKLVFDEETGGSLKVHPAISKIIESTGKTIQQIIFKFAQQVAMIPITGSTSLPHLASNLAIGDFELDQKQLAAIENIAFLPD